LLLCGLSQLLSWLIFPSIALNSFLLDPKEILEDKAKLYDRVQGKFGEIELKVGDEEVAIFA